jgi:ribosomal protein S18 acetylase RimI-like enzyme
VEPVIRTATIDDAPALLALWRAADAIPSVTDDVESIELLFARDPECAFVAVAGERVVGSVIAGWDGWRGTIYRLAVDPAYRRRGLGGRLVEMALERLRALGARRIGAIVMSDHSSAMAFWHGSGWELHETAVRFIRTL